MVSGPAPHDAKHLRRPCLFPTLNVWWGCLPFVVYALWWFTHDYIKAPHIRLVAQMLLTNNQKCPRWLVASPTATGVIYCACCLIYAGRPEACVNSSARGLGRGGDGGGAANYLHAPLIAVNQRV